MFASGLAHRAKGDKCVYLAFYPQPANCFRPRSSCRLRRRNRRRPQRSAALSQEGPDEQGPAASRSNGAEHSVELLAALNFVTSGQLENRVGNHNE